MEVHKPRRVFLWSMATIYMVAFVSLYLQIPGLYGNEGLLPTRQQQPLIGSLYEQLLSWPSLLGLGPQLGLDTPATMELLCVLGALLSLAAMLVEALRDSVVFLCLWFLYLSLYQVGVVFLYFQWDNLLLETGFLTILVAPLTLIRGSGGVREHDRVTFWLVRWLLFRLMFASGVVKLTSRCPTWWGLTALTYHYETQCIPTPLAWFAHQFPVWWQKLSVVGTYVIEIGAPFLFFSPLRRLRLGAFYLQVLLQLLIILSGNYNFFNLLTLTLCLSLLDDQHVQFWLRNREKNAGHKKGSHWSNWLCYLLEVIVWSLLLFGTILLFDLQLDPVKTSITSRTVFTFHQFNQFVKTVTIPCVWMGVLSLTWEMISSIFRCVCVTGFLRRFWGMFQWSVFAAASGSLFAISLVPFSYLDYDSHGRLWPAVRQAHQLVDRYQLVNSYGLFRRMTGVGGRPEVVIEGSYDGVTWTEIEFMYKPGNLSAPPSVVTPHQPRLDWQMWFAALGPHSQAPWFTNLMLRLLQGKRDVMELIQADVSRYPFHQQPPTFVRAHRYRYWFTQHKPDGSGPARWWRRVYVEEFYPMVHLGSPVLESMLSQHGLKEKLPPRRLSNTTLVKLLRWSRSLVRGIPAHTIIWSLLACSATLGLLMELLVRKRRSERAGTSTEKQSSDFKSDHKQVKQQEEEEEENQDVCMNEESEEKEDSEEEEEEEDNLDGEEEENEDELEK